MKKHGLAEERRILVSNALILKENVDNLNFIVFFCKSMEVENLMLCCNVVLVISL